LGDFTWNLGTDDVAEVSPDPVQVSPVQANPVEPTPVHYEAVRIEAVRSEVPTQPMTRRERRAAEAAARPAEVEAAATPLAEFFQAAEMSVQPSAQALQASAPEDSESQDAALPDPAPQDFTQQDFTQQHPAASSRRAARRAAASEALRSQPTSPATPDRAVDTQQSGTKQSNKRLSGKKFGKRLGKTAGAQASSGRTGRRPSISRTSRHRSFFSKLFSVGTMVGIAAIMVSTSLPANAFFNPASASVPAQQQSSTHAAQSMKVASTAAQPAVSRDAYTVSSLLEQLKLKYGNRNFSYTNDINGTIQWPFPVPVPISSGFGPRIAPCGGCSSVHEGVDFTPGRGVAIGSIADGVVSAVIASHSGLGNHVIVDHMINGQLVQSVYGHMLDNTFAVTVGETVKVTQKLGEVGSTGESTGAHLHLEIHINGVPVDPFAWLKANAN
jgi:murein DD-endopeptidase MepM/ murein hydrolase activator NlpD